MPHKRIEDRRRASRESARRRRAQEKAKAAEAAALPESPSPPDDDGDFIILRHRCVRCLEVSEVAVPPIGGLGEVEVSTLEGVCAICRQMPAEDDAEPGADLGAAPDPSRRSSPEPAPLVARPARPSMADVIKAGLAAGNNRPDLLVTDSAGKVRPVADVLLDEANLAAHSARSLDHRHADGRNHQYEPNRHGAIQTSAGREGEQAPAAVDLPATGERVAVTVRPAAIRPTRTVYIMPR